MSIEIPDEYGLSSDSLRGSHQFVRADLVDSQDSKDALTGRPNPRAPLSSNEILALENVGVLVDESGYERKPEPVEQVAPVPIMQPRVRREDSSPALDVQPTPHGDTDKTNPLNVPPRYDVQPSPAYVPAQPSPTYAPPSQYDVQPSPTYTPPNPPPIGEYPPTTQSEDRS